MFKQFQLCLNFSVSLYFCFWQLLVIKDKFGSSDNDPSLSATISTETVQTSSQSEWLSMLIDILQALLFCVSPIFHYQACTHPPYCYKNHCPAPHHYKAQQEQMSPDQFSQYANPSSHIQSGLYQPPFIFSSNTAIAETTSLKKLGTQLLTHEEVMERQQKKDQHQQKGSRYEGNADANAKANDDECSIGSPLPPSLTENNNKSSQFFSPENKQHHFLKTDSHNIFDSQSPQTSPLKVCRLSPSRNQPYQSSVPQVIYTCQYCEQCQLPKYLRMKHCYQCNKCVHKYDHHCVLLDVCIGQFNQKFYLGFLASHFYNTILVLRYLLEWILSEVWLDPLTGIQHLTGSYFLFAFFIIVMSVNFILSTYLVSLHFRFVLNGSTTYQKQRRSVIAYFKHLRKFPDMYVNHKGLVFSELTTSNKIEDMPDPFNFGIWQNLRNILTASSDNPIDWKLKPLLNDFVSVHTKNTKKSKSKKGNSSNFQQRPQHLNEMANVKEFRQLHNNRNDGHHKYNVAYDQSHLDQVDDDYEQYDGRIDQNQNNANTTTKSRQSLTLKSQRSQSDRVINFKKTVSK